MKIVQLSDIHIFGGGIKTFERALFNKRILGGLNAAIRRKKHYSQILLERVLEFIKEEIVPDIIIISGDISTTGIDIEVSTFKDIIQEKLENYTDIVIIPGNHDLYIKGEDFFHSYFNKDREYPIIFKKGDTVIFGLNSSYPTGLIKADGKIDNEQLKKFKTILERYKDYFKILVIHHFLLNYRGNKKLDSRSLKNREKLLEEINFSDIDLIIHGHDHHLYFYYLTLENRKNIPVFCPGPSSHIGKGHTARAGFLLYELSDSKKFSVKRYYQYQNNHFTYRLLFKSA